MPNDDFDESSPPSRLKLKRVLPPNSTPALRLMPPYVIIPKLTGTAAHHETETEIETTQHVATVGFIIRTIGTRITVLFHRNLS